uniref:Uncharacterized protein n=1 Tax=Panagrolaimus superbus TaxID=310955 RepID=A0A914Z6P6_9BILA
MNPSIIQNRAPTVSVLKDPIHPPRPYGLAPRSAKSYSKSHKTDSLSGRHDLNIKHMVENPLQTLERCKPSVINDEMKKFYPTDGKAHGLDGREIAILCCRISAMFRIIEELIGAAEEKLKKRGVKFDGMVLLLKFLQKAHDYLMSAKCHEYVRSFAIWRPLS